MGAYWNRSRFIRASEQGVFDWVHIDTHWVPMCTHFSPFGSQAKKSRSRAVFQPLGSDVHPIAFNSVCPAQTAFRLAENANSDTKCRTSPILSFSTRPPNREHAHAICCSAQACRLGNRYAVSRGCPTRQKERIWRTSTVGGTAARARPSHRRRATLNRVGYGVDRPLDGGSKQRQGLRA